VKPWYQDPERLRAALAEHGTWVAVSKATSTPESTLKTWAGKLGVSARIARSGEGDSTPDERLVQQNDLLKLGDRTAQELVLLWSDLHAAEVVSLEETRGINEYNWSIMEQRMEDRSGGLLAHRPLRLQHLDAHVAMLGDMLSGDIHEELKVTNDRPLAEAVVDLA
jgi:hypothetical protein